MSVPQIEQVRQVIKEAFRQTVDALTGVTIHATASFQKMLNEKYTQWNLVKDSGESFEDWCGKNFLELLQHPQSKEIFSLTKGQMPLKQMENIEQAQGFFSTIAENRCFNWLAEQDLQILKSTGSNHRVQTLQHQMKDSLSHQKESKQKEVDDENDETPTP